MSYPLMKLSFHVRDVYGMDYPDLRAEFDILRDPDALTYSLPDLYTDEDRKGYSAGTWQLVSVRLSLYNDTGHVVARVQQDDVEFGMMSVGFVNPLSNPDDFPMHNLFRDAMDDYDVRNGMPL